MINELTTIGSLEKAKSYLVACQNISDIKDIRDKAEAIRQYGKVSGETIDTVNIATEIKLRAERRAGELLKELNIKAGNPQLSNDTTIRLKDMDISRDESSRFQKIASIPEKKFENLIDTAKKEHEELSTNQALRLEKELNSNKNNKPTSISNDIKCKHCIEGCPICESHPDLLKEIKENLKNSKTEYPEYCNFFFGAYKTMTGHEYDFSGVDGKFIKDTMKHIDLETFKAICDFLVSSAKKGVDKKKDFDLFRIIETLSPAKIYSQRNYIIKKMNEGKNKPKMDFAADAKKWRGE